jgi:hypothetical protein
MSSKAQMSEPNKLYVPFGEANAEIEIMGRRNDREAISSKPLV